jgi:hypothetical protein
MAFARFYKMHDNKNEKNGFVIHAQHLSAVLQLSKRTLNLSGQLVDACLGSQTGAKAHYFVCL